MRFNVVNYLIGEGIRNLFKNKKSTMSALMIMCATMLIFGIFFMIIENINSAVKTIELQQGMQVFIQKDASDEQISQIGEQIKAINGVNTIKFISKEDALNYNREKLGNPALFVGYDEENPFKASYLVTLTDLKLSSEVQENIYKLDNIASITSQDNTINNLVKIANGIKIVSIVVLSLLVIISIFIIANTIKLTVHARRKEISIMKYVGATDSFIRWPFIIEGIIIGIIAAIISLAILGLAYNLIISKLGNSAVLAKIGMSLLSFADISTLLVIVYLVLGIGIGALGSTISMRKYLKV